jgi:adenylate cyclase
MEIERKFRVRGSPWRDMGRGVALCQGYLGATGSTTVRVRIGGEKAWLTVKGPTTGIARAEFEYAIPRADGDALLELCGDRIVEKTRYVWREAESRFEIDVFEGRNAGLVVAEIELQHPEQNFVHPEWLGEEVSHEARYRNSELSVRPYSEWFSESLPGSPGDSSSLA